MSDTVIKSAARVLEIFEYFSERQTPASVGDIARNLGFPQSSTSVLLKSLYSLGYLDYDPQARLYNPTMRIAFLGSWVQQRALGGNNLISILEQVHTETNELVLLGMQNGVTVQYAHIVESTHPVRMHLKIGTRRPITRAAVGRVLLSLQPDAEIKKILRRVNSEEPVAANRMKEADLLTEIEKVRAFGFAETSGSMTPGGGVIATLLDIPEGPPMAVGVGAPLERLQKNRDHIMKVLDKYRTQISVPFRAIAS